MEPEPQKVAWKASRTCPECEGLGLAVRYRQRSTGAPAILYCLCALGRYMRSEGRGPDGCLDLADYHWLQGEDGQRYHTPPKPAPVMQKDTPTDPQWWRTGKARQQRPEPVGTS